MNSNKVNRSTCPTDDLAHPPLAYRIADACRVVGLSRGSIYRAVRSGRLQLVKFGRRSLIPADSLRALVAPPSPPNPPVNSKEIK